MKITCRYCNHEVEVSMYFYGEKIITTDDFLNLNRNYEALTNGKTICPICGKEIREIFRSIITKDDIVRFATKKRTDK